MEMYYIKNENGSFSLDAYLSDGKLLIKGEDCGKVVGEVWSGSSYEYRYDFDATNTERLFEVLDIHETDDEKRLERLQPLLNDLDSMAKLRDRCKQTGITYQFSSYSGD